MATPFHWIIALVLITLLYGVSLGEESKVETNDEKLVALCFYPEGTPEAIEVVLKAGADVMVRLVNGLTPLMIAAGRNNNPEVIETLLKAGANAKAKDKEGKTALDYAKHNEKIYNTKAYRKLNELQSD